MGIVKNSDVLNTNANGGRTCFDFIYIRYVCHVQRILPKSQKNTVKKRHIMTQKSITI